MIVRVREFGDPLTQIREGLLKPGKIWREQDKKRESVDAALLLVSACERLKRDGKRLLLLFDQFEVILIRLEAGSEETNALRRLFAAILDEGATRYSNLVVLLSFCSDYDHLLKTLDLPGQHEDENSKKVSAFSRGAASNFLTDAGSGLRLGSERVKAVLDEAEAVDGTRGLIRPIVLNMLGKLLQRLAGKDLSGVPRGALLSDDIRRAVEDPRVRDYARPVLKKLIHNGIRVPRTIAQTAAATGLAPHLVEGCHRVLLEWPLVRCIEHSEQIEQSRWEIAHDFIARLIAPILETPRRSLVERARSIAAPVLLLCSIALLALYVINNPQNKRNEIFARLARDYGIHTEEEDGAIRASASNKNKLTDKTLPLAVHLLSQLGQVVDLDLRLCAKLTNVDALTVLKKLKTLNLGFCANLENLNGLKELEALTTLDVSYMDKLENLDALKDLRTLTVLDLHSCDKLENVDALKNLKALTMLELHSCAKLENIDALQELKELRSLDLSSCPRLKHVDMVVTVLPNLQFLDLRGTPVQNRAAIKEKMDALRAHFRED